MDSDDDYTKDGTMDIYKRPANKKKTGTWKACPYILGMMFLLIHRSSCVRIMSLTCIGFWIYRGWSMWAFGVLWYEYKFGELYSKEAQSRCCFFFKSCKQLVWNLLCHAIDWSILGWCLSWPLLDNCWFLIPLYHC